MNDLITVPTFRFDQGNVFDGAELPLQVSFYDSGYGKAMIQIEQDGDCINFTDADQIVQFLKQVKRHLPEALKALNRKQS